MAWKEGVGVVRTGKEIVLMAADGAKNLVSATTGYDVYNGQLSQAGQALADGSLTPGKFLKDLVVNAVTLGTAPIIGSTYDYLTGQIDDEQFAEQMGSGATGTLLTAFGLRGTQIGNAPLGATIKSIPSSARNAITSVRNFGRSLVLDETIESSPLVNADRVAGELKASAMAKGKAAAENKVVIGKLDDITAVKLRNGERSLVDQLPDLGNVKSNWQQNSSVLRQEMRRGLPIRDASVDSAGNLIQNRGFLRAERELLRNHGWTYDPDSQLWSPPLIAN